MYRLIDPDLLEGRNRPQWVAAAASAPARSRSRPRRVEVRDRTVRRRRAATVTLAIGDDRVVPVELGPAPAPVGGGAVRRRRRGHRATVIVGGILLTGGTSRRLGVDKATLVVDGVTLAGRAAAAAPGARASPRSRSVPATPISRRCARTRRVAVRSPRSSPGAAALGGRIGASPDAVVLLACDLPNAGPALDALLAAPRAALVVPVDGDGRAAVRVRAVRRRRSSHRAALLGGGGAFAPRARRDACPPADRDRAHRLRARSRSPTSTRPPTPGDGARSVPR